MILNRKYSADMKLSAMRDWQQYNFAEDAIFKIMDKYECSRRILYYWKCLYLEGLSLINKSPIAKHYPTKLTEQELKIIKKTLIEHPEYGIMQHYTECAKDDNFGRSYGVTVKYIHLFETTSTHEYNHNTKPYYNPVMYGTKWQMDVKFVPCETFGGCLLGQYNKDKKYKLYQYTIIDMTTNRVFRYGYDQHCADSTIDFVKRAIAYFGYLPKVVQTDNGTEFTNKYILKTKHSSVHPLDQLFNKLCIKHKLIPPSRPQHNGKVERVHGLDQARFYAFRKFKSLADLNDQITEYNEKHNNTRTRVLRNRNGKVRYLTPMEKQEELLLMLKQQKENDAKSQNTQSKTLIKIAMRLGNTAKCVLIEKEVRLRDVNWCDIERLNLLLAS
jgi:transposase InsO family protein